MTWTISGIISPGAAKPIRGETRGGQDHGRCRSVEDLSPHGLPLSAVAVENGDYRFLVSGNYMIFYRPHGSDVYVDRVLYGRRDYLRILFGDISSEEP